MPKLGAQFWERLPQVIREKTSERLCLVGQTCPTFHQCNLRRRLIVEAIGRTELPMFGKHRIGWQQTDPEARSDRCLHTHQALVGDGVPEATAFYIHARLHKMSPRVGAAFHTHMPNATALSMVEGEPLVWAGQTALKFYGRVAVDENYNGLALDEREGDRIASVLGDKDILFMKNHGVMVCAPSIAEAWDDLYYLERAAEVQLKAMGSGRKLLPVLPDVAAETARQMREGYPESARMHLQSIRRLLERQAPDYRD